MSCGTHRTCEVRSQCYQISSRCVCTLMSVGRKLTVCCRDLLIATSAGTLCHKNGTDICCSKCQWQWDDGATYDSLNASVDLAMTCKVTLTDESFTAN